MEAAIGLALAGCAVQVDARTPLHRDSSSPRARADTEPSLGLAMLSTPNRGHGVLLGGEIETHLRDRAPNESPSTIAVANGGFLAGYVLQPGRAGGHSPGLQAYVLTGAGEPAGQEVERGTHYRVGAGSAILLPLTPRDIEDGFVLFGFTLEALIEARGSVWAPPEGSTRDVILESTLGLGIRVRTFSDLLSASGHPRRTLSD